ncbi:MAG: hypothetical protein ABTA23_03710 [Solibacillus sp.]
MLIAIKQGDTRHAVRATLKTLEGVPIDLSGTTIIFKMSNRHVGTFIEREAVYETDGKVHFIFQGGETENAGMYDAEFEVTYADGRIETFPHSGKIQVYIEKRIGGVISGV